MLIYRGFTIAEGSFYIKSSGEHFFSPVSRRETRQRSHPTLFEAFKLVFKTNRKIEDDGKHTKFSVSSTKDLINVVTFTAREQIIVDYIVYLD